MLVAVITVALFLVNAVFGGVKELHEVSKRSGDAVKSEPVDAAEGRSLTFLLLGTDSRLGQENLNIGGGDDESVRADTTIVVKIAPDRKSAIMASMPRDALVDIPSCPLSNGNTVPARRNAMFNSAFSYAAGANHNNLDDGIACAVRTFKSVTGIPLDGVVVADFAGFSRLVDTIGGVNVCLSEPFRPAAVGDFALPKGKSHLVGSEAIQFVRARKGVGDGSDTQRQVRQHYFLKNAWKRVEARGTLSNPIEAVKLLQSAKSMVQVSSSLADPSTLAGFAYHMSGLRPQNIISLRVPFEYAGPRVVLTDDAQNIWDLFKPSTGPMQMPSPEVPQGDVEEWRPATQDQPEPEGETTKPSSSTATPDSSVVPTQSGTLELSQEEQLGLLECSQDD